MTPLPFHPSPPSQPLAGSPANALLIRGPHFTYCLPTGWSVGEEGKFALVLRSPDFLASIVVFGQSGLMQPMSPEQFAHGAMTGVMRLATEVRLGPSRPIPPMPGYTHAAMFETSYTVLAPTGPVPIRGQVVCNVAIGHGQCNGTLTLAGSAAYQWDHYASWLPRVAMAALNTGPDPYGSGTMAGVISGIAQQDHRAYQGYHAWSQQLWQQVGDARNAAIDRQQGAMDQVLTGQHWIREGFGGQDIRRSATPACIWRSRDGREARSDDPAFDPRTPSDVDWVRVQ